MTAALRLMVLGALWSPLARAAVYDFNCLSLLKLIHQHEVQRQAIHTERADINDWQRFLHFEELLKIENKLRLKMPLSPEETKILAAFEARTTARFDGSSVPREDVILEYLSTLSRAPEENLKVGLRFLERYFKQSSYGYSRRTNFYFDHLHRLLTSVPHLDGKELRAQKQKMLKIVFKNMNEYPELKILWGDLETRLSAKHRAQQYRDLMMDPEPALPPSPKRALVAELEAAPSKLVKVTRAFHEQTPYMVDKDKPTPVAYWSDRMNMIDPENFSEGFGDHGFWIRPGAMIRLTEIFADHLASGVPLENDLVATRSKPMSLVFAIEVRPEDVYFDEGLTQRLDQYSEFEMARFSGRSGNMLLGYVSPTVFIKRPPYKF